MNAVDRQIETIKAARERERTDREWFLHCDQVRKNKLFNNWAAVKREIKRGIEKIHHDFPGEEIMYDEVPERTITLRRFRFPSATVTAAISLDGATISIDTLGHRNATDMGTETHLEVEIKVEGDATYYSDDDQPQSADEVAAKILKPILDSLR